jgi:hypothetical protein
MRRWIILLAVIVAAGGGGLLAVPSIVAWQLERNLGSRPIDRLIEVAAHNNTAALLSIAKPLILVDIPTEIPRKAIEQALIDAASGLELPAGWRATLRDGASATFMTNGIRARAWVDVENVGVGTAAIEVSVDAIPHLRDQNIVFDLALSSASVERVSLRGFRLPSPIPQVLTETVQKSLDAINTRLKPVVVPAKVPPKLVAGDPASAILVSQDAIIVLIGTKLTPPKPALTASYQDDFIAAARQVEAGYRPGTGVIAVAQSENTLPNTSETLRASSLAINLAMTEAMLGVDHAADPANITSDLSRLLVATISPAHFEKEMERILRDAIAKVSPDAIELAIKPDDVKVKTIQGALEAVAKGSAKFLKGAVTIDFTLTAWGVVDPSDTGLRARYAVRDFQIHRLLASWKDHEAPFSVDHSAALASLVLKMIKELPETTLKVPAIGLNLPKPEGDIQVRFRDENATIAPTGRATLLSPERIIILVAPTITNKINVGSLFSVNVSPSLPLAVSSLKIPPQASPNFDRLRQLIQGPYKRIFMGDETADLLNLGMSRAGLARLINSYWGVVRPALYANVRKHDDIPASEIQAIPGDASCSSTCAKAESCGDVGGCRFEICRDGLRAACRALCPAGFLGRVNPCVRECERRTDRECRSDDSRNRSCISAIESCVQGAGTCLAAWTSGLQLTCEVAMRAIDATDFRGLAKISGDVSVAGGGQTLDEMRLTIAPDLKSAALVSAAKANAKIDASLNIVWTDFGNLLLCPSGTLSGQFNVAAPPQSISVSTGIGWTGGGDNPLKATLTPAKIKVQLAASEPPLTTLVRNNPGLLSCGLGRTVVGLSLAVAPRITSDLIGGALRKLVKNDSGAVISAVIDGKYQLEIDVKPIDVELPSIRFQLAGQETVLRPRLSDEALVYAAR